MSNEPFGPGYRSLFQPGRLTLGINFPIEAYANPVPLMHNQIALAQAAERGGFAALWSRDVPLLDPSFGDAGQIYDPWVWLGFLAAHTTNIALGTASIILPLRKPVDLAKAAASVDQLSGGRLILGVASGDRPVEYSVYDVEYDQRDALFRENLGYLRANSHRPSDWNDQQAAYSGKLHLLPKSVHGEIPLLVTGNSCQSIDWIARHANGWLMYPRQVSHQRVIIEQWQEALKTNSQPWKPFAQSLYIDLTDDPDTSPAPIHLGYRLGRNPLLAHLASLSEIGVNHVTFNIRFSGRPVDEVMNELCEYVVPAFPTLTTG